MPARLALPSLWSLVLLASLVAGTGGLAQGLPIPGLPGGLGGITTPQAQGQDTTGGTGAGQSEAPVAGQGLSGSAPTVSGTSPDVETPTQALIDILRDDSAREALIRELQAARDRGVDAQPVAPSIPTPAPPAASPAPTGDATPDIVDTADETFGAQAIALTRAIGARIGEELRTLWLRAQRVPSTLSLSLRAFEGDVLEDALREAGTLFVAFYASLFILRLILGLIRRRAERAARNVGVARRFLLRVSATIIDLVAVPLAVFAGVFAVLAFGFATESEDGDIIFTDAQALFTNAFVAVETTRALIRFVLSPRTPDLRLIGLGEVAVNRLWSLSNVVVYLLGYGQLFAVPAVTEGISIFVGRAASAALSSTVVLIVIIAVLASRGAVARKLHSPDYDGMMDDTLRALADRWHWPVLVYLLFLLGVVLTRPGNVLLPLLWTTAQCMIAVAIGSMAANALGEGSTQRMRVPQGVARRLPLLEERLNQLVPTFLRVLRVGIVLLTVLAVLEILQVSDLGGILSSGFVERISSGVLSVLLIATILSVLWLAMASWIDYKLNPFVGSVPTPREITLLTLLKNATTVALVILGLITSLAQLGMNVGPLLASAGVIGLAISFGAQKMVEDIFSGIFIQAEGAMNVGDVVEVSGTVGTVEKLTVRSVTLRDLSGVVHVIPFSSAAKISNYNRDFAYHVADMGVAYREDLDEVKAAMFAGFEELQAHPDFGQYVLGDLEWFGLNAFGASEVQMRARIKTVPGQQWGVGRAYNAIMKRVFDARGIEIPFPHQTVYFGEDKRGVAPPVHIKMDAFDGSAASAAKPAPPAEPPRPVSLEEMPEPRLRGVIHGTDIPDSDDR